VKSVEYISKQVFQMRRISKSQSAL